MASSPCEVANLFAEFFQSNFVRDNINSYNLPECNQFSSLNFGNLNLSSEDLSEGILALKPSSQTDVDGLSVILFKKCPAIVAPLKIIFNKSLSAGVFVDDWKLTTVTPIFKSGKKNDVRNYRPISKLSTTSKLFEAIIKEKVYFATKSLISSNQHGFVSGRSTVSNLAVFSEYCIESFSSGLQVDCIYTDFSKAFDTVSHRILLRKLGSFGFHSIFLQWLESYLSERRCLVTIGANPLLLSLPLQGYLKEVF